MVGCGSRTAPGRKKTGPTAGQEERTMGVSQHSRYRTEVGKLQFMINEVLEIAGAVENLSRLNRVPTETNLAHIGTKHLPCHRLKFLSSWTGNTPRTQRRPERTLENTTMNPARIRRLVNTDDYDESSMRGSTRIS